MIRPLRPRLTKVWRRKSEVQNKNNDEDSTLEIDEVSKEEKHAENLKKEDNEKHANKVGQAHKAKRVRNLHMEWKHP